MARNDKRIDSYLAIDSERDFQDEKFAGQLNLSISENLHVMEKLLSDAKTKWYYGDSEDALNHVRKVAAVATRTMEVHGSPLRKPA
jgi:hypothetical protein